MVPYPNARVRYNNDPIFGSLVDNLTVLLDRAEFTPSELREAVILAAVRAEEMKPVRYILTPDQFDEKVLAGLRAGKDDSYQEDAQ